MKRSDSDEASLVSFPLQENGEFTVGAGTYHVENMQNANLVPDPKRNLLETGFRGIKGSKYETVSGIPKFVLKGHNVRL
jgi:hypothetical protein